MATEKADPQEEVINDVESMAEEGCQDSTICSSMSKKALKRQMKYQAIVMEKKAKRKEEKERKKARKREASERQTAIEGDLGNSDTAHEVDDDNRKHSKKYSNKAIRERLEDAMKSGQRICVDCGFESNMDKKEVCKLAQQLGRLYGANRHAEKPFHIYFTNLHKDEAIYKECVRVNCGFENYLIEMTDKSHLESFDRSEIVYLTPDSANVLEFLEPDKVYIIGGLVDESPQKNVTLKNAEKFDVKTAQLPIDKYMEKVEGKFNYSKILTINQVFDILLTFYNTGDWKKALVAGVPRRKGYKLMEADKKL
ncbi:tRNA methyltransferase 10 homolog B-like [Ptychodera flava]|uniref:tRNA methyltransferase 10 homolog B-like n=1 Tax=Ptychodera flava TaxID=63121 RepID=UPI00396A810A